MLRTLIRSKIDYGCATYSSDKPNWLKIINPTHNQEVIIATGAFRSSPVPDLLAEAGEAPLNARKEQLVPIYMTKISASQTTL